MPTTQPSRTARLALLGLAVGLAGCTTYDSTRMADRQGPLESSTPLDLPAEVERLAAPLVTSGAAHSFSIGVLTADATRHQFGYHPPGAAAPGAETIFQIGSVTKPFVATLLAILVQEGALSYTNTIREILPPEVRLRPRLAEVTLYELVTHTAGLPLHPQPVAKWPYFLDFAFSGRNPYRYITRAYLYQYLRSCEVPPRVARRYDYSNLSYGLLGHLIEVRTGRTLPELLAEKIFTPLGMNDTTFRLTAEQRLRLLPGHAGDEPTFIRRNQAVREWDFGEIMRASGGLYSTTHDLLRFAQAQFNATNNPLVKQLEITHPIQFDTPLQGITLAWVAERTPQYRSTTLSRIGVAAGYCAFLGFDTEAGVAVAVLGNNFNWTDKIGLKLLHRLTAHTLAASPASRARPAQQAAARP